MNKFYKRVIAAQILLDYISVVVSFVIGYLLWRPIRPDVPFQLVLYLKFSILYGFVYIFTFWLIRLYEEDLSILNVEQLRRIIKGWIIGSGVLFSIGFLSKEFSFSRLTFVFTITILFFILIIQRTFFFGLWQKLHRKGIGVHKTIIIGVDDTAISLFYILVNCPWLGIVPIGFVDDSISEVIGKDNRIYSTLGKTDDLEKIISIHKVEQAIITYSKFTSEHFHKILGICSKFKLRIKIVPHFYNVSIQRVQIENLLGIPLLGINVPKSKWIYFVIKRILDIIISTVILVCLSPMLLIFATIIKMDSSGPVLFIQERVGKGGKIFKMYKFRTMHLGADKYERCPESLNDPRITRVGKFLRRTGFDELPQLFNVLYGEMSIVGPRPEMKFIVEKYNNLQKERLRVKPGITGLWQISHKRGSPIHESIDYDFYYIENRSFTLDLAIILGTLFSIYKGIGAY